MSTSMIKYLIGIDGGATKTIARITSTDTREQAIPVELTAGSCSLSQNFEQASSTVKQLITELMQLVNCQAKQVSIAMGLAGAGNDELKQQFSQDLYQYFQINEGQLLVTTDAETSLFGANNGQAAVCLALGTGSVAMSLDGDGRLKIFGGWGASIADEGGAVFIGKQAVRAMLWEYDQKNTFESDLSIKISEYLGNNRTQILNWLSQAKAVDYAKLAPLVTQLKDDCVLAHKVFIEHIKQVEMLAQTALKSNNIPLILLGGLAEITSPYLSDNLKSRLLSPQGNSVDGACLLARRQLIEKQEFTKCR